MREAPELTIRDTRQSHKKKPQQRPARLTEPEKRSIIAAVAAGQSQAAVARRFKVHANTVWSLCKSVRTVPDSPLSSAWRAEQLPKAVAAVDAGLECIDDPYRRADIGVKVLTGLGHYRKEEGGETNYNLFVTQINALPDHLKKLFHSETDVIVTDTTHSTSREPRS